MKTVIAIYDLHVPYQIDLTSFIEFLKDTQPDELILWWDMIDCEWVSRFYKWSTESGLYRTNKEILEFKKILKQFKKVTPKTKIVYLLGNHEYRIVEKLQENPEREKLIWLTKNLWTYIDEWRQYNEYYEVWGLHYMHWTYHNDLHSKKHALMFQRSVRYWHLHTNQEYCLATPAWEEVVSSKAVPCMSYINPDYMKNRPSPWMNWFNIAYFNDEWVNDYNIIINNWTFIFNNKQYGNK